MTTNTYPAFEKLDLEGDTASVGLKWEKWKRSLSIYLQVTDITSPTKKRATLLLLGGSGLQEIFYNLPGANIDKAAEGTDVFEIALKKLDDYFLPKQSKVYERHIFRLIKQEVERQNKDILKRLKIGRLEGKDIRKSLCEYLMMYNTTPHSVTGKTPAELFFRRKNRDKIPAFQDIEKTDDSEIRGRDTEQKEKGKDYGDRKRRAKKP